MGSVRNSANDGFEDRFFINFLETGVEIEKPLALGIHQQATEEGHKTHQQWQVKAVNNRQVILGNVAAQSGRRCSIEQWADGERREHANHQAGEDQDLNRYFHVPWRLMGRKDRQVDGPTVEKHVVDESRRVGNGKYAGQCCNKRRQIGPQAGKIQFQGFGEEHLLAQETIEQRHTRHRRCRHHGQRGGMRHVAPETIDPAHVPGAGLMVNNAGGHKQRRLEYCVVDHVKDRGDGSQLGPHTEQQGDQAKMTDR